MVVLRATLDLTLQAFRTTTPPVKNALVDSDTVPGVQQNAPCQESIPEATSHDKGESSSVDDTEGFGAQHMAASDDEVVASSGDRTEPGAAAAEEAS